jgi:hypothetical protein
MREKKTMTPGMIRERIAAMKAEINTLIAETSARIGLDTLCRETGDIITVGV